MYVRPMGKAAITTDSMAHAIDTLDALDNAIRVELLDWIVEYDECDAWREDGACSMADWLAFRRGHSRHTAAEFVRVAHALRSLRSVRAAFAEGRLSWDKVVLITTVADRESEALWASEAEHMSVARIALWVRDHRRMRREEAERRLHERYVHLRWADDDTLRINGRLVGAEAATVKQAIEHLAEQQPKREDGTYAPFEHRCADALAELASCELSELDRATVIVHVDAADLNHINGRGHLDNGPSIVSETVRRLACDGKLQLSIDGEHGQPLKLGRTKRTVSAWQARQIRNRDKGCRFCDCGRTRGLQMHHINHWAHGGTTDDDNLISLCWHHHRLVHEGGWRIRKDEQERLRFIRPDGRPLIDRKIPLDPQVRERMFDGSRRE